MNPIHDKCGILSLGVKASRGQFDCDDIPSRDILVTVNDKYSNQVNCSTQVKIVDKLGPDIICKKRVNLVAEPKATSFKLLNNTNLVYIESISDNCGTITNTIVSPQEVKLNNILPTKVNLNRDFSVDFLLRAKFGI